MSLLSRLNSIAKGAGHVAASSFDSVHDALAKLDNDDDSLSFGDFLAVFKRGTQAQRASTPIVMRDRTGTPVADKSTFTALGVKSQPYGKEAFVPAGPGQNVAAFSAPIMQGIDDLKQSLEPVGQRIPEPVRDFGKAGYDFIAEPVGLAVDAMNTAYNGVSRGLSTVVLASELQADTALQDQIKDMPYWERLGYVNRLAWDAAKTTSPGQAISYAALGGNHIDITDPEAVGKVLDSPLFDYTSGGIDAALRIYADPTAVALRGSTAALEARRVKQAAAFASEDATVVGSAAEQAAGVDKLYEAFRTAESPAEVRRRFFPSRNNQAAHIQSTALWDAAHLADDATPAVRDAEALGARAAREGVDAGGDAARLVKPAAPIDPSLLSNSTDVAGIPTEVVNEGVKPRGRFGKGGTTAEGVVNIGNPASKEKFNVLLRAMLGNEEAGALLKEADAALAEQVARAQMYRGWLYTTVTPDAADPLRRVTMPTEFIPGSNVMPFGDPQLSTAVQREMIDKVIDNLMPQALRAQRETDLINTVAATGGQLPRATLRSAIRTNVVRSEFWQTSPMGRTLRVFADINPQRYLNLHEADFDVQVDRLLTNVGFEQGARDVWRTEAMRAGSASARRSVMASLDDAVIDFYAGKYGLDADMIRDARNAARGELDNMIATARYDTENETTILRTINEAGEAEDYRLPLHPTQLENWAGLPDYKALEKIAKTQAGKWTNRELATAFVDAKIMNPFYRVWKPSVLFGIRTPTRIVGEEALRFMSVVGVQDATAQMGRNVAAKLADRLGLSDEELRYLPGAARRPVTGPLIEGAASPSLGSDGMLNAFSSALNQSAGGVLPYGVAQDGQWAKLADSMKDWRTLTGTDPGHLEAWVNDINKQIRQSRLARRLLDNGGDIEDAVRWMRTTDEGRTTLRANRLWARDPEGWAMSVEDQLQRYLPTDGLRDAARKGAVSGDMLVEAFPDAVSRPNVHGQWLGYTVGEDHVSRTLNAMLDRWHEKTAVQPSIQLTRQPMFDAVYRRSIEDQANAALRIGRRNKWTMEELRQVERNAHRVAMGAVRETLYDMAEYSRFAEATRFVAPFSNATREVATTWLGIAVKNPAFVRRIQIAWKAPERAGLVYDSAGNQVHDDGTATSPLGRKVKAEPGRTIRARFPDWANDIPGLGHVIPDHDVYINKDSLNTLLANPYGTSPVIELAMARLVDDPDSETHLKAFFPYGIERSLWKPFLPGSVRAVVDKDAQAKAAMQIYWSRVAEYEANGRQGEKPTMSEAKSTAASFAWLQALAKVTLPASVREASPMQPYIDIYREMQRTNPEDAQQEFLDKYGVEYAALTTSMTKSLNKVQPTLQAWQRSKEWEDFIAKYPDLGALAVGEVSDPFNSAVYDKQKRSRIGGENFDPQRRDITLNEAQETPEVTAGWYEFSRGMDLIEAERIRRGLPNLRVKGAQQLYEAKQAFIEALSKRYETWGDEYRKDDPAAYEKKIDGMREIVKRAPDRPDVKYLGYYLSFRDGMENLLNERVQRGRSGTLDSASNRDLLLAWETGVSLLLQKSPAFQRMWNRYLDHDQPRGHQQKAA